MAKKNNNGGGNDTIRVSANDQALVRKKLQNRFNGCLLYTSPSPRDGLLSRMPSSA